MAAAGAAIPAGAATPVAARWGGGAPQGNRGSNGGAWGPKRSRAAESVDQGRTQGDGGEGPSPSLGA